MKVLTHYALLQQVRSKACLDTYFMVVIQPQGTLVNTHKDYLCFFLQV